MIQNISAHISNSVSEFLCFLVLITYFDYTYWWSRVCECVECRCLQWCKSKHILNTENTFGLYFTYYCSQFRLIDLLWFVYSVQSIRSQSAPDTISDPSINNTEKLDICALHIYMENRWIWIFQMNRNVCGSATEASKVLLENNIVITVTTEEAFIMIVNLSIWNQWMAITIIFMN